jgi:hypothetical protein
MDGELDTATPYGSDRECIGDGRDGVTILVADIQAEAAEKVVAEIRSQDGEA